MSLPKDTNDPRTAKAIALASRPGAWLKVRDHDGVVIYGIPSQRTEARYWLTDGTFCECPDFRYRGLSRMRLGQGGAHLHCKHIRAVAIALEQGDR